MIESSFSCSSSWDLEPFQNISEIPFLDYDNLERDYSQFESFPSVNETSNSSDYDSIYFDAIDKLPITDSFISEILAENYTGFQDERSFPQDMENDTSPVESISSTVRDSPKKAKKTLDSLANKSWSKMSTEEQFETLHSLSKIVTCHMGIREQIKVIKIIDPTVTISPNDTEFALDISHINDVKLKRIQELVRKCKYSLSNSKKLKSSSKLLGQKTSLSNKVFSGRTNPKAKRKQKKQKTCTDEDILKKRKLELHGQKEIQSGLFVYEKVIKLSNPLEDEDVNILE